MITVREFHHLSYLLSEEVFWSLQAALAKMKRERKRFAGNLQSTTAPRSPPCDKMHSPSRWHRITAWRMDARSWPGLSGKCLRHSGTRKGQPTFPESFSLNHANFFKFFEKPVGGHRWEVGSCKSEEDGTGAERRARRASAGASSHTQMAQPLCAPRSLVSPPPTRPLSAASDQRPELGPGHPGSIHIKPRGQGWVWKQWGVYATITILSCLLAVLGIEPRSLHMLSKHVLPLSYIPALINVFKRMGQKKISWNCFPVL
jgi:hypothetical protein